MKKVFVLLLIFFITTASFAQGGGHAPADTRVITKCGFTSSWGALIAREKEGIFAGPGESEVTTTNLAPDLNSWCYTVTITCNAVNNSHSIYNTLSEHCGYTTAQDAEAAYQSALTDQKRCHFVDEQESGTYLHWIGMDQVEICYKVVGW